MIDVMTPEEKAKKNFCFGCEEPKATHYCSDCMDNEVRLHWKHRRGLDKAVVEARKEREEYWEQLVGDLKKTEDIKIEKARKEIFDWFDEQRKNNNMWRWSVDELIGRAVER